MISKKIIFAAIAVCGLLLIAAGVLIPYLLFTSEPEVPQTSVAIIGGADSPTAEYLTSTLVKELYMVQYLPLTIIGGVILIIGAVAFAVTHSHKED